MLTWADDCSIENNSFYKCNVIIIQGNLMNHPEIRWYFPQKALLHMVGEIIQ